MNWKKCHQISAKARRSLARNGETVAQRNQESAYANALNGTKFSAKI
jgi:hypothetical protein